ncbi:helix-turn-helix domain-containing protein [Litoreibacter roseus]|uniref:AraC family transcriptional regulator n=1 Tax=Litoreibacter roseus TaxID=2601869 RepID=A0A6N6JFD2_9RHOB|nr:helix-turn-helix domain-containing protein [Litoreibacter roseus]GFE64936.1 AraC family transcriptional regulator [Litoreibacter roseus]
MKTWQVTSEDVQVGLSKWADGLQEAFVQLEPVATVQDGFFGQIRQVTAADLTVSMVTSNGHEVRRLPSHIRRRAGDTVFMNVLSRGRSFVTQSDLQEIAPMDISIVDTRAPFAIRHDSPFQLASIALPSDWVAADLVCHHALSRSAAGRELSSIIWSLAQAFLTASPENDQFRVSLVGQIQHSLALLSQIEKTEAAPHTAVEMLQSYVRRHLDHPELRAAQLAAHFGVSVRRVHQLFEPTGHTVSEFINDTRLSRAAELLVDPDAVHRSISDVAWKVGYGDPSYFTRRFRRRFGCSPRAYRRAAQPVPIARES